MIIIMAFANKGYQWFPLDPHLLILQSPFHVHVK